MSDLEPIGEHVEALLRRIGLPRAPALARLLDEWASLAGEPWGSTATPVGLEAGVLVVDVLDGGHASLLRYQVGHLVDRLSNELGAGVVTGVRIRVGKGKNPY